MLPVSSPARKEPESTQGLVALLPNHEAFGRSRPIPQQAQTLPSGANLGIPSVCSKHRSPGLPMATEHLTWGWGSWGDEPEEPPQGVALSLSPEGGLGLALPPWVTDSESRTQVRGSMAGTLILRQGLPPGQTACSSWPGHTQYPSRNVLSAWRSWGPLL